MARLRKLGRLAGVFGGCIGSMTAVAAQSGKVDVLYAGSLLNTMEHGIGPAFDKTEGGSFRGYAGGSNGLANQIKGKLRRGDVFISANPNVDHALEGAQNGDWVRWYIDFARSPLVLGYNPSSRFAAAFKTKPWYQVLQEPGIRIGRTDAKLDPKGALTLKLMDRAAQAYKLPGLAERVLGPADNPAQVRPEENLVGQIQSGQLDVGFFYSTETADLKIPSVSLPSEVALEANYTVTILRDAPNPAGAADFVSFLLGAQGRTILREHGLDLVPPHLEGDAGTLPTSLRQVLAPAK